MKSIKAKQILQLSVFMVATLGIAASTGCESTPPANNTNVASTQTSPSAAAAPTPGSAEIPTTAATPKPGGPGTITISPNPIKVCDKSGVGVATISWTLAPGIMADVRIGSPNGTLFVQAGGPGTKETGKWVGNGSTFYLQNVSNGLPLTAANTIAKASATITTEGCP
jgi:hypothetical protein